MKKIIATSLAALLCLSLTAPAAMAYGPWDGRTAVSSNLWTGMALGLNNFRQTRDYTPGVFSDVPAGAWYEAKPFQSPQFEALNKMNLMSLI